MRVWTITTPCSVTLTHVYQLGHVVYNLPSDAQLFLRAKLCTRGFVRGPFFFPVGWGSFVCSHFSWCAPKESRGLYNGYSKRSTLNISKGCAQLGGNSDQYRWINQCVGISQRKSVLKVQRRELVSRGRISESFRVAHSLAFRYWLFFFIDSLHIDLCKMRGV